MRFSISETLSAGLEIEVEDPREDAGGQMAALDEAARRASAADRFRERGFV